MKTRIRRILVAAILAACTEQAVTTAPRVEGRKSHLNIEGPQQAPPGVPPEYDIPTDLSVTAGAGADRIATGSRTYGQSAVNYVATTGLARVKLEVEGYPDAFGEAQESSLLPIDHGVTATAIRNIPETCGKSLRAEAFGSAWNEFVGLSVLTWGRKSDTKTYPYELDACQIPQPPSSRYVQEEDENGCQVYVVEERNSAGFWVEIDRFYVCPDDDTGFYSRGLLERPMNGSSATPAAGALLNQTSARAAGARSAGRSATIQFVGTGFMDARTHLTIHAGGRQADAIVLVDTMRASPEDLEAALMAVNQLGSVLAGGARIDVAKHVLRGRSTARAAERAAPLLEAIKRSRATTRAQGYVGRSLKVSVALPATREGQRKH